MEDEVVTAEGALWLNYQIAKARLDKTSWRQSWRKSGVMLVDSAIERDFQEAKNWFREHPTFVSQEIKNSYIHKGLVPFLTFPQPLLKKS